MRLNERILLACRRILPTLGLAMSCTTMQKRPRWSIPAFFKRCTFDLRIFNVPRHHDHRHNISINVILRTQLNYIHECVSKHFSHSIIYTPRINIYFYFFWGGAKTRPVYYGFKLMALGSEHDRNVDLWKLIACMHNPGTAANDRTLYTVIRCT